MVGQTKLRIKVVQHQLFMGLHLALYVVYISNSVRDHGTRAIQQFVHVMWITQLGQPGRRERYGVDPGRASEGHRKGIGKIGNFLMGPSTMKRFDAPGGPGHRKGIGKNRKEKHIPDTCHRENNSVMNHNLFSLQFDWICVRNTMYS